ncbi:MAG: hypothetical protein AVDCRST_MAG59-1121, partial [uncultured Thermomicrobiales bacterium]
WASAPSPPPSPTRPASPATGSGWRPRCGPPRPVLTEGTT